MRITDDEKEIAELEYFFNPRSIALVGVSRDLRKPSGRSLNALIKWGYKGKLYPINPRYPDINGIPCYPSLLDIENEVDMVVISIPAEAVLKSLEECVAKKVRAVVIFSSGFAEVGPTGISLQRQVTKLAKKNNLRILGPNCVGLVNLHNCVMASFANIVDLKPVYPMNLGFVTQSGAFGTLIFTQAVAAGVGFSSFVSVGNEADTEFADFLSYLLTTSETKVIGGYLEGAKNGQKLRRAAKEALRLKKPVLIMKVGRTGAGARAASSHTGSLAGDDQIYDAFFRQTGIIRIEALSELTSFVTIHRSGRIPQGNNIGILSISGGAGVVMADKSESLGLRVPEFKGKTRRLLESYLPPFGCAQNPVDLTSVAVAEPEMLGKCLRAIVADNSIHMIAVTTGFMPHMAPILAKDIIDAYHSTTKPIILIANISSTSEIIARAIQSMEDEGIPILKDHLHAIQSLSNLAWYYEKVRQHEADAKTPVAKIRPRREAMERLKSKDALTELEAKRVLAAYGIPVTRETLATSAEMAVIKAREIGYPVAMKIVSAQIPHKTDAGCVCLNISSDREVRAAFRNIMANAKKYLNNDTKSIRGALVQEMVSEGVEVIVGATCDPVFGHVLMFGLGGIFVEAIKDVSFRIAPISRQDAFAMVRQIRGYAVLQKARGRQKADIDAIVNTLLRVSALVTDHGDKIAELDINPLIVSSRGAKVADALIVKQRPI